jgi:hypothetical protein
MCCCATPNVNGQPGYRWQPDDPPGIRPVHPPPLEAGDELLYDEPGRCGDCDCHSHHYRLVRRLGSYELLVQHGGGVERIRTPFRKQVGTLAPLESDARYWIFNAIYRAHNDGEQHARDKVNAYWRKAAAEKRIKTCKVKAGVKVWVEDPPAPGMA